MIEAMACGTPVLALNRGSVPEVLEDGLTGIIVDTVEQAIAALPRALSLDRNAVRRRFEQRFSARRMAQDYLTLYARAAAVRRIPAVDEVVAPELVAVQNPPEAGMVRRFS